MFTFRSLISMFLIPLCFSSMISAQQVVDDNKAGSSHDAEEQAYALLLESCNAAPNIDVQLINEHGMPASYTRPPHERAHQARVSVIPGRGLDC